MIVYHSRVQLPYFHAVRSATRWCCFAGAMFILAVSSPQGAQGEENNSTAPTWQGVLALQLKDGHRCDFDKVLFDRDIDVGGRTTKEGRVRCLDGREFDFSRPSTHEKFDIRLCQPTVC